MVRFYAWEPSFLKRVGTVRTQEIDVLKRLNIVKALFILVFLVMPYVAPHFEVVAADECSSVSHPTVHL